MEKYNFELLLFFMNENVILTEIKRSSLDNEVNKSELHTWIKINANTQEVESLNLKSMKSEIVNDNEINVRTFANGELRFDNYFAKFQHNGSGQILMKCAVEEVPDIFIQKINSFINS